MADELTPLEPQGSFVTPAHSRFAKVMGWRQFNTHEEVEAAKLEFLLALEREVYRTKAAKAMGVPYGTFLNWLETDADFRDAVTEIEAQETERHREEITRRAVHGLEKPIYWQGQRVDGVGGNPVNYQYSDLLLIFEMKRRDEQYRDRAPVENNVQLKLYQNIDDTKI